MALAGFLAMGRAAICNRRLNPERRSYSGAPRARRWLTAVRRTRARHLPKGGLIRAAGAQRIGWAAAHGLGRIALARAQPLG